MHTHAHTEAASGPLVSQITATHTLTFFHRLVPTPTHNHGHGHSGTHSHCNKGQSAPGKTGLPSRVHQSLAAPSTSCKSGGKQRGGEGITVLADGL